MKEFWVEYNWEETRFGIRPNMIRIFKVKAEAEDFVKTTVDGKIMEVTMVEC